ncbi:MAG: hypothetical protein RMJ28_07250 [Nitrososphaerota archaeon]|nr:hypothetical protein [Candidatus Calditenuaceae archaeon]MDW8074010.1 hypothetical protein [Nitrososphaerota archaeon]
MKLQTLALTGLIVAFTLAAYSVAMSMPNLSQLGGTGQVAVIKTDVRVTRVQVPLTGTTISTVTADIAVTQPGSYRVVAYVSVGACSASGEVTVTLGTGTTTVIIPLASTCAFNAPVTVRVRVYQP